jgi:hypothetical protein
MKRSRRFPLLFLAAALAASLSCSSDQGTTDPVVSPPTAPEQPGGLPEASLLGSGIPARLLICSSLPYASTTETIGPDGGTISVGPHTLVIPAGALGQDVDITAEVPGDSAVSIRLLPEGLTFADSAPARLTLSYSNCSFLARLQLKRIAYTTDNLDDLLNLLPSIDDLLGQKVSASLEHFSRYAVSW